MTKFHAHNMIHSLSNCKFITSSVAHAQCARRAFCHIARRSLEISNIRPCLYARTREFSVTLVYARDIYVSGY